MNIECNFLSFFRWKKAKKKFFYTCDSQLLNGNKRQNPICGGELEGKYYKILIDLINLPLRCAVLQTSCVNSSSQIENFDECARKSQTVFLLRFS